VFRYQRPAAATAIATCLLWPIGFAGRTAQVPSGGSTSHADVPQSCTVFLISDGETVLGGGNEDQAAFPARAWFVPAEEGKHGCFYVGFENVVESGMNDQGLFYDSLAAPERSTEAEEGKALHVGMWTLWALETCATVDDVVELLHRTSIVGTWDSQIFFGDRNGDSIIVEGEKVIHSEGRYQICTNFLQSRVAPDPITCARYRRVDQILGELKTVSSEAVRDVFAAVAATSASGAGTAYTMIYDSRGKTVTGYFWRDFEHPIVFDLTAELAKGPHCVELASAAQPNPNRDKWVAAAQSELDRSIEARIGRTVDLAVAKDELVGHYAVEASVGMLHFPPVMIEGVSLVWVRDLPQLVVAPEGIGFELRPAGGDVWFHVNVTDKPEMDVILQRDPSGEVSGLTLKLIGLGDVPFVKLSDEPRYEPLPSRVL